MNGEVSVSSLIGTPRLARRVPGGSNEEEGKDEGNKNMICTSGDGDGVLYFTLSNLNVSIANSLRRVILSDIPTLAFKTFPDKENQANITTNTSRFNNEILKQLLMPV